MAAIEKRIPIIRMDCPTCIPTLEKAVSGLEGVDEVKGNYIYKYLRVVYNPEKVNLESIEKAIEDVGYQVAYKEYPSVVSRLVNLFRKDERDKVVKPLSDQDFPGKVLHSSKPVVVLFSSRMCPSCLVFKPSFEELAEERKGEFYEMDISTTETWRNFGVMSIPTVIIFKDGKVLDKFTATLKTDDIKKALY
jgi:thioredoxin 1